MYPDIGKCGAELNVSFDEPSNAWVVHMRKGQHELKHFLEISDAEDCLQGQQCVSLGLDIAQMLHHIKEEQF